METDGKDRAYTVCVARTERRYLTVDIEAPSPEDAERMVSDMDDRGEFRYRWKSETKPDVNTTYVAMET